MSKNTRRQIAPLSISQNFLTSSHTIKSLLSQTDISKNDFVLEIGPGKGHITRELIPRCSVVKAVEADPKLYDYLTDTFANTPNLTLLCRDFLTMPLPKQPYKVFSNIPFNITTDIVRKLTEAPNPPFSAWLLMEKGAAMRFSGGSRDTKSSLLLKPYFDVKIVRRLSRENFHPMPSVDCALLGITKKESPDIGFSERGQYEKFITGCFKNGVESMLTRRQVTTAFRLAKLPSIPESGNMLYVQWLCLFRCWLRYGHA